MRCAICDQLLDVVELEFNGRVKPCPVCLAISKEAAEMRLYNHVDPNGKVQPMLVDLNTGEVPIMDDEFDDFEYDNELNNDFDSYNDVEKDNGW